MKNEKNCNRENSICWCPECFSLGEDTHYCVECGERYTSDLDSCYDCIGGEILPLPCGECATTPVPHDNCLYGGKRIGHSEIHCTANSCY
jgi:hypothetical protein